MSTKKKFDLSANIQHLIRQKQKEIEAQNETWDISNEAISERKKKLNDPKNGFSFFVQNVQYHIDSLESNDLLNHLIRLAQYRIDSLKIVAQRIEVLTSFVIV